MSWLSFAAGCKSPDKMTRKELLVLISAFEDFREAEKFWLKFALTKVSKKSFMNARGYQ
jgi:hypothetical protein